MTEGSHNFVKLTDIKPNYQKHSGFVFASGKNTMYPIDLLWIYDSYSGVRECTLV